MVTIRGLARSLWIPYRHCGMVPRQGRRLGCKDKDAPSAFCVNKIGKGIEQRHGIGEWSPWTKETPNKL
jgi:hypothetical protein